MARSPSRSRSPASSPPARRRSRTRSRSPISPSRSRSRSRSGSPPGRHSRSRSRSNSRSRSRSVSDAGKNTWDNDAVDYGDFIPADEESPTFFLSEATVQLVRDRVYQAPPLGKKHYNDLKKDKYILQRSTHETLEPKPVPAQAVSSMNGMDLNKLHGSFHTLHNVARIAQRPIWSSMETVQKTRGNLKKLAPLSFVSPPYLTSPTSPLPDGHVELDYSEEERLRHMAKCPQNPSQEDIKDMHASIGVYKKFYEQAGKSMFSMVSALREQTGHFGNVKTALDEVWSRYQDYINMARFFETQIKEMRRTQLVKAHTKDFINWLENIHLKDREHLGARDKSDEILAANYDSVLKAYNEFKKNKNTALKSSYPPRRATTSGSEYRRDSHGPGSSGSNYKKDSRRDDPAPRRDEPRPGTSGRQYKKTKNKGNYQPKGAKSSKDSAPPKDGKGKAA